MTPETLSCPYCNTFVTITNPGGDSQRVRCPRCHEVFLFRSAGQGSASRGRGEPLCSPQDGEDIEQMPHFRRESGKWSNRSIAAMFLGVMGTMAVIGLIFAWYTIQARRNRDNQSPGGSGVTRVISIAPAKLPALGYLPADTDVIMGFHIAELLEEPASRELVADLRAGPASVGIGFLEQWTGLPLEEIDQVVLGLKTRSWPVPQLILIVRTRKPYDADALLKSLKAAPLSKSRERTFYRFQSPQSRLGGVLWLDRESTLAIGLTQQDLEHMPLQPREGVEHLSEPLRTLLLMEHMREGTQAWVVGQVSDWEKILNPQPLPGLAVMTLPRLSKEDREVLGPVRSFGACLQVDKDAKGTLVANCADEAAAVKLHDYFTRYRVEAGRPVNVFGYRVKGEQLIKEIAKTEAISQKDNSVTLQAAASMEAIRRAVFDAP